MADILQLIEEVQQDIFRFHIPVAMQKVAEIIDHLMLLANRLENSTLLQLMGIITHMNQALGNKDYLLLADLLQYELKPFIEPLYLSHPEGQDESV